MPNVEGRISGVELTPELVTRFEVEITRGLQEDVATAFASELGFREGTAEFLVAERAARRIMPGWTWVSIEPRRWAIRGQHQGDDAIVARFHVLVLANALFQNFRQEIVQVIRRVAAEILGEFGKPVHLFVDVTEGEVDMTLPADLFGDLLQGEDHRLLKVGDVIQFIMGNVTRELERSQA